MIEKIKKEIQRQLQESEERLSHINARGFVAPNEEQLIVHLKGLLSFIDALEVKGVNLEKEIDNYIFTDNGRQRLALELSWKQCNITFSYGKLIDFAKHFFELGIAVSNKAQKGE